MKYVFRCWLFCFSFNSIGQDCCDASYGWREFIANSRPDTLSTLSFDFFECTSLPDRIFSAKRLKKLKILATELEYLSPKINKFKDLEELTMSKSKIKTLPLEVFDLENLRYLAIAGGCLESIPRQIGLLRNLETLWLGQNNLHSLPKEIVHLKKLKYLNISNNPISEEQRNRIRRILPNCEIKF